MSLDEARLCAVIWSWLLADGNAKTRSPLYHCLYCLGFAAGVEVRRDGATDPAPHPEIVGLTWPQADSVFRRLGIDHLDLAAYWRAAKHEADDACYPMEWLTAFFPPAIWPMLITLIQWGPERTAVHFEQVATIMGQTPIQKATRRRPAGSKTARSTIGTRLDSVWRLMRQFNRVRTRVKASASPTLAVGLLDSWTHMPEKPNLIDCGTVPSGLDNGGPSLDECRARLQLFVADWEANPDYQWRRLRRVILLSLILLLGPRADALRTAMTDDYDPQRLWPDGVRRPTLTIRPGKTREWHEEHFLPLPVEVKEWLEAWMALTGEKCGEASRPIFPGRPVAEKPVPLSKSAFYAAVAGHGSTHSQRALVPLADDEHVGMRPHGFRKAASELAHQGAIAVKKKHPGMYDHLTPEHFSRALLAHNLTQGVADVYRSLDAQRLTSVVVEEAWKVVWPDEEGASGDHDEVAEVVVCEPQLNQLGIDLLRIAMTGNVEQLATGLAGHADVLRMLADAVAAA